MDSDTTFEVIGSAETTLGKIAGASSFSQEIDIHLDNKPESRGKLIAKVAPVIESKWNVLL